MSTTMETSNYTHMQTPSRPPPSIMSSNASESSSSRTTDTLAHRPRSTASSSWSRDEHTHEEYDLVTPPSTACDSTDDELQTTITPRTLGSSRDGKADCSCWRCRLDEVVTPPRLSKPLGFARDGDGKTDERFVSPDESLLISGKWSDCVISCGAEGRRVHQSILASRSQWFRERLEKWDETQSHHEPINIRIQEFQMEAVDVVLRYLYTGMVEIDQGICSGNMYAACVTVYKMGKFFRIPELSEEGLRSLTIYCASLQVFISNESPKSPNPGRPPTFEVEDLILGIRAANDAYPIKGNGCFPVFANTIWDSLWELMTYPAFLALLKEIPALAVSLVVRSAPNAEQKRGIELLLEESWF